jgi:hypothetical protein
MAQYPGHITIMITRGTEAAGLKIPLETAAALTMDEMTVEQLRDNLHSSINREVTTLAAQLTQRAVEQDLGGIENID